MMYKIQLSNKDSISISEQEFEKFKANISSNFIEFKNGIVNPSFVMSVVVDQAATEQQLRNSNKSPLVLSDPDIRGTKKISDLLEKSKPEFLRK